MPQHDRWALYLVELVAEQHRCYIPSNLLTNTRLFALDSQHRAVLLFPTDCPRLHMPLELPYFVCGSVWSSAYKLMHVSSLWAQSTTSLPEYFSLLCYHGRQKSPLHSYLHQLEGSTSDWRCCLVREVKIVLVVVPSAWLVEKSLQ